MYKKHTKKILSVKKGGKSRLGGFTLIELLLLVLIVGILTAMALPRYELAVFKSRANGAMVLARALKTAQDVYYLANGAYTWDPEALDVQIPSNCSYRLFPNRSDKAVISCPHADFVFRQDGPNVAQVIAEPFNCPGGSYKCVRLVFPYGQTRAFSVYQAFTEPYCDTWLGQDSEQSNKLCRILSGNTEGKIVSSGYHAYKLL